MARTKGKVTEIKTEGQDDFAKGVAADIASEADRMSEIERSYTQERSLVNQMLGEASTLRASATFFGAGFLLKMRQVKESKSYKSLSGQSLILLDGTRLKLGTWDAFCQSVGSSRAKVDEDLLNLQSFGEDALCSMHQVGLGQKDLRKLRRLELTDRDVVIGELEANLDDKDSVIELIEEMASKHVKERDDLAKQLTDTEATLEASRRIADEKTTELNRAKEKLDRRENDPDWVEETNELSLQIAGAVGPIIASVNALSEIGAAVQVFRSNFPDADDCSVEYLDGVYYDLVKQVIERVAQLQYETDMVCGYISEKPTWLLQIGRFDPKTKLYVEEDSEQSEQTIN